MYKRRSIRRRCSLSEGPAVKCKSRGGTSAALRRSLRNFVNYEEITDQYNMLVIPKFYCNRYQSNRSYRGKMIIFLLTAILLADGCDAQTNEEICDPHKLSKCVHTSLRTQLELPGNKKDLDKQCLTYRKDTACMDTWIKSCLAKHEPEKQNLVQDRIGGARALVQNLCSNDTELRRDFLKEMSCWSLVSPDWSRCVDKLQLTSRGISMRKDITDFNKTNEICCAHDAFVSCVDYAGRSCSPAAGALLQRMSWMLAEDVAACSLDEDQPREPCSSAIVPRLSALLPFLYYVYYI